MIPRAHESNESAPQISVIMTTYNRAGLIAETIESVRHQTFADWELVIVDDGSTDNTQEVIEAFHDARIRYCWQQNAGAAAARNTGIALARGEWLSFFDSDDLMLPHNLETLAKTLAAHADAGCAYGWNYFMNASGQPLSYAFDSIEGVIPPQLDAPWPGNMPPVCGTSVEGQILTHLLCELDGTIIVGTLLVRRCWICKIGGFDPSLNQSQDDWDFFIRLARAGCLFVCARQAVMIYRDHGGGAHRNFEKVLAAGLNVLDHLYADAESDAALKAQIAHVRGKAYSAHYLWAAEFFFESGQFASGAQRLNLALRYAPASTDQVNKAVSGLVRWMLANPETQDESVIGRALAPVEPREVGRQAERHALGLFAFELAFRAHQSGQRRQVLAHSLKAVAHDPRLLRNRGLAKVALSSLVPQKH